MVLCRTKPSASIGYGRFGDKSGDIGAEVEIRAENAKHIHRHSDLDRNNETPSAGYGLRRNANGPAPSAANPLVRFFFVLSVPHSPLQRGHHASKRPLPSSSLQWMVSSDAVTCIMFCDGYFRPRLGSGQARLLDGAWLGYLMGPGSGT